MNIKKLLKLVDNTDNSGTLESILVVMTFNDNTSRVWCAGNTKTPDYTHMKEAVNRCEEHPFFEMTII